MHGQYHVQLPDGRLQHVSYHVDDYNGYIADVSYDGHAEHPSHHGHGYEHGGGQRFGKTLIHENAGASLPISVAKVSSEQFNDRKGKAIGQQQFLPSSNKAATEPFQSFPSPGVFSHRFGEPSGSSGRFHDQPAKPFNSFVSKKPVEPLESSLFPKSLGQFGNGFVRRPFEPQLSESFGQNDASPGNEQFKQENSFFTGRKFQQSTHDQSVSSQNNGKDLSSRHGKSRRQDLDELSSNLFGSSSHSKAVVHGNIETESKILKSINTFQRKFGEPKTNDFVEGIEKSGTPFSCCSW